MRATQILQRLRELSQSKRIELQTLLNDYARERFVARLGAHSVLPRHLLLKGGFLLHCLMGDGGFRPTKDLDLTFDERPRPLPTDGFSAHSALPDDGDPVDWSIADIIRQIAVVELPDGVEFELAEMREEPIREQEIYGGTRVTLPAKVGGLRALVFIDIGMGDVVTPQPTLVRVPVLLEVSSVLPTLSIPLETVIAEKFDAILERGMANSRLKDYFDIWLIATRHSFEFHGLAWACKRTRHRRRRGLVNGNAPGLSENYVERQTATWQTKWQKPFGTPPMGDVVTLIRGFLEPVLSALVGQNEFRRGATWSPGGPWHEEPQQ